jgi:hypothetical protein
MITMPAWVRLGPPMASTRKPITLAPVLRTIIGAVQVSRRHNRQCMPRAAVPRPVIPTFIAYDVLDVIGGGRRAR